MFLGLTSTSLGRVRHDDDCTCCTWGDLPHMGLVARYCLRHIRLVFVVSLEELAVELFGCCSKLFFCADPYEVPSLASLSPDERPDLSGEWQHSWCFQKLSVAMPLPFPEFGEQDPKYCDNRQISRSKSQQFL